MLLTTYPAFVRGIRLNQARTVVALLYGTSVFAALYLMAISIFLREDFGWLNYLFCSFYLVVTVFFSKVSFWLLRIKRPTPKELKRQDIGIMALATAALLAKLVSDSDASVMLLNEVALMAACVAFGLQLAKVTHEYTEIQDA